ncbi:amidase [Amycolatopsis jejuensis]|uniref:amidase n=1 Tax=Amycolatopsis jejuensis TaxID=330084 RepID=UPI0005248EAB|nr:amidase [Amycolatopsis jejuensis]
MTDLAKLTAAQLSAAYAAGELSPVEATRAALQAIDTHNDAYRAFAHVDHEGALAQAKAAEQRWSEGRSLSALDGVPVSIKDLFLTQGMPTLAGSPSTDPTQPWDTDSPAAARLRENGLVLLGKTTTAEFGWKGVTDNAIDGITRNPWDPSLTAGGSSGGSAVAVSTGMGAVSVATDGAGSVRIPSAFCGIVGFKPTYGRIPMYPPSVLGTLAHAGPMARTVADVAAMTDVLAVPDHRDPSADGAETESYRAWPDVRGVRVAFSPALGRVQVDPEVAAVVAAAVADLAAAGFAVTETDPDLPDLLGAFEVLWSMGFAHRLERSRRERGAAAEPADPGLRRMAAQGARLTAYDYQAAQSELAGLGIRMGEFHTRYDVLITPTVPIPPFAAGYDVPPGSGLRSWAEWCPFSFPFNMTRQPAISVPVGFTAQGLPVGLQIVGARHADRLVLAVAAAVEALQADRRGNAEAK